MMKLKERINKLKATVVVAITLVCVTFQTSIAYADPSTALTTAEGKVDSQVKTIVNSVIQPVLELILVAALLIAIGHAVYSYRKARELELGWPIILIIGLILVTTFQAWGWTLIS